MPFVRTHSCFRFLRAVFSIFFFIYYLLHWPQLTLFHLAFMRCTLAACYILHTVRQRKPHFEFNGNRSTIVSYFSRRLEHNNGKKWLVFLTTCQHGHCNHKRKPFWFWLALNLAYDSDGGTSEQSPLSLWWAERLSASNQCSATILQN